jgi:post-segregation antitoxin (ccd killing protein)
MQERQETTCTVQLIQHDNDDHFVINMTSLHNAAQIRKILPCNLTAPKPLYENRKARHFEIASILRVTQAEKRECTKAKAKATREANKAKKRKQREHVSGDGLDRDADIESEEPISDGDDNVQEDNVQTGNKRRRTDL